MPDGLWWRARAACKDAPLDLVDACFERKSGASQEMRDDYCRRCPVADLCLREALETGEMGVWGGTTSQIRTAHGSRRYLNASPDPERLQRGRE